MMDASGLKYLRCIQSVRYLSPDVVDSNQVRHVRDIDLIPSIGIAVRRATVWQNLHYGDKTAIRSFYYNKGISNTGKTTYLY